jgi:predicted metal-dependent hydrolase
MSTGKVSHIRLAGMKVDIVRKDIKNLHLGVYPPMGRIRIAAPFRLKDDAIRVFASSKIAWIKKHRKKFHEQPRETVREYVSGESHYVKGKRYLLKIAYNDVPPSVKIQNKTNLILCVRPKSKRVQKEIVMTEWYRSELKKQIPKLIEKWEKIVGVTVQDWGVKK